MRAGVGVGAAGLLLATLLAVAMPAAAAAPELSLSAGSALGVNGEPGSGGAATSVGMSWPVTERFAFGARLFADDLGTGVAALRDPNTGLALGTVATTHRWSFGGTWLAEWSLHESRGVRLLWGAGFGYGRQEHDQRGQVRDGISGTVASTALTFLLKAAPGHAIGTTLAIKREFVHRASDPARATNWATAALEWRWKGTPRE